LKATQARFIVWDRYEPIGSPARRSVTVRVVDVVDDPESGSRLRLDALSAWPGLPRPGERAGWSRLVEISSDEEMSSLQVGSNSTGPVPFRWQALDAPRLRQPAPPNGAPPDPADPEMAFILQGMNSWMKIAPPYRGPLLSFDLGHLDSLTSPAYRLSPAGVESVDGHDAVRLAWISQQDPASRGFLWILPDRDFLIVRSESFRTRPSGPRSVRRRQAGDFAQVNGLWIAREFKTRVSAIDGAGKTLEEREQVARIEDLAIRADGGQAGPTVGKTSLGGRLPILGIDEKSGDFLTNPPELPPDLLARLNQAVRESPFGPPAPPPDDELPQEMPPAADVKAPDPVENPTAAPPAAVAKPAAEAPPTATAPEAIAPKPSADQPAVPPAAEAPKAGAKPQDDPDKLIQGESPADLVALLQIRRDGKAAEVRKAEAQVELPKAGVVRGEQLRKRGSGYVSDDEIAKVRGELSVAEAEVAIRKAELVEADFRLDQARRRAGPAGPKPPAGAEPPADVPAGGGPSSLADARDAVELLEVQLGAKRAEAQGEVKGVALAQRQLARTRSLVARDAVEARVADDDEIKLQAAQDKLALKASELEVHEVRLKQARRRVEAETARLKREAARAKVELERLEDLHRRKIIGDSPVEAARDRLDDLMLQLDPNAKPTATGGPPATPATP